MKTTFSDRLKQARQLRGYTQQALARASGLSQSAVASYENGDRESSRSLRKLAEVLDVSADWLETGKGSMERPSPYEAPARGAERGNSLREPPHVPWPFSADPRRVAALGIDQLQVLDRLIDAYLEACQPRTAKPARAAKRRG